MNGLPEPPYSPDIRAKGWLLELDCERIVQSDTWTLAGPEFRPWLMMLWLASWTASPVATLPADPAVIKARIGIGEEAWRMGESVLLRGWVEHSNRRLYHPVLTEQVLRMIGRRQADRARQDAWRVKRADAMPPPRSGPQAAPPPSPEPAVVGEFEPPPAPPRNPAVPKLQKDDLFEAAWLEYPQRPGRSKVAAMKAWQARVKAGCDPAQMLAGTKRYADYCRTMRTEAQYIKQPASFFGTDMHFNDNWIPPPTSNSRHGSGVDWGQQESFKERDYRQAVERVAALAPGAAAKIPPRTRPIVIDADEARQYGIE